MYVCNVMYGMQCRYACMYACVCACAFVVCMSVMCVCNAMYACVAM